jgi:hypothetical protein
MSKKNEQKEKKKYTKSKTSRLQNPEVLQLHQNHEKFLFMTVLLLFFTMQNALLVISNWT